MNHLSKISLSNESLGTVDSDENTEKKTLVNDVTKRTVTSYLKQAVSIVIYLPPFVIVKLLKFIVAIFNLSQKKHNQLEKISQNLFNKMQYHKPGNNSDVLINKNKNKNKIEFFVPNYKKSTRGKIVSTKKNITMDPLGVLVSKTDDKSSKFESSKEKTVQKVLHAKKELFKQEILDPGQLSVEENGEKIIKEVDANQTEEYEIDTTVLRQNSALDEEKSITALKDDIKPDKQTVISKTLKEKVSVATVSDKTYALHAEIDFLDSIGIKKINISKFKIETFYKIAGDQIKKAIRLGATYELVKISNFLFKNDDNSLNIVKGKSFHKNYDVDSILNELLARGTIIQIQELFPNLIFHEFRSKSLNISKLTRIINNINLKDMDKNANLYNIYKNTNLNFINHSANLSYQIKDQLIRDLNKQDNKYHSNLFKNQFHYSIVLSFQNNLPRKNLRESLHKILANFKDKNLVTYLFETVKAYEEDNVMFRDHMWDLILEPQYTHNKKSFLTLILQNVKQKNEVISLHKLLAHAIDSVQLDSINLDSFDEDSQAIAAQDFMVSILRNKGEKINKLCQGDEIKSEFSAFKLNIFLHLAIINNQYSKEKFNTDSNNLNIILNILSISSSKSMSDIFELNRDETMMFLQDCNFNQDDMKIILDKADEILASFKESKK